LEVILLLECPSDGKAIVRFQCEGGHILTHEEMPHVFIAQHTIRNGESEYVLWHWVDAPTFREAERIARRYASDFWGEETIRDKDNPDTFWSPDETELIHFDSVKELPMHEALAQLKIPYD